MKIRLIETNETPLPLTSFRPGDIVMAEHSRYPYLVVGRGAGSVQGCVYLPIADDDDFCPFRKTADRETGRYFKVGRMVIEGEEVARE